jgi:SMC interacting uncharacterized protein involved in chromosome segregation
MLEHEIDPSMNKIYEHTVSINSMEIERKNLCERYKIVRAKQNGVESEALMSALKNKENGLLNEMKALTENINKLRIKLNKAL